MIEQQQHVQLLTVGKIDLDRAHVQRMMDMHRLKIGAARKDAPAFANGKSHDDDEP